MSAPEWWWRLVHMQHVIGGLSHCPHRSCDPGRDRCLSAPLELAEWGAGPVGIGGDRRGSVGTGGDRGGARGFENGHRLGAPVVVLRSSGVLA
eukprot:scaffold47012_cov28-Phaeocystis_antarctica.AAC.1